MKVVLRVTYFDTKRKKRFETLPISAIVSHGLRRLLRYLPARGVMLPGRILQSEQAVVLNLMSSQTWVFDKCVSAQTGTFNLV